MSAGSRAFAASSLLVLAGCVGVPEDAGFADVQEFVSARIDQRIRWRRETAEDGLAAAEVERLLAVPLTAEAAVQIALLENRTLQAELERLGIAHADLVQASLLRNPALTAGVGLPDRAPSRAKLEFGVVQDFLDVLLRPGRVRIAEAQLEETKLSVASKVVELAGDVRRSYFVALGAEQVAVMRRLVVDAAAASAELAHRLHEAGNISDLQLAGELGLYESARVDWARSETDSVAAREDLARHLGLWNARASWTLPDGLPDVPEAEIPLADLESLAIATRLDLAAARKDSEALARALGVTRDWRFLAVAEIGVVAERETDGTWLTGPELVLELPVFDQRQAAVARLASELRRADQRVFALAIDIRSEVRGARHRLVALRRLVEHYRDVVIPLREATVALTQQEYDFMLVGAFELLAAKQAEYDAYQEYVEAVRDYWIARSDIERAVGGVVARAHAVSETRHEEHGGS